MARQTTDLLIFVAFWLIRIKPKSNRVIFKLCPSEHATLKNWTIAITIFHDVRNNRLHIVHIKNCYLDGKYLLVSLVSLAAAHH